MSAHSEARLARIPGKRMRQARNARVSSAVSLQASTAEASLPVVSVRRGATGASVRTLGQHALPITTSSLVLPVAHPTHIFVGSSQTHFRE